MEKEIELYLHYDASGNITASVVPDNGNFLKIPAATQPAERDDLVNAFKANQLALGQSD